MPVCNRTMLVCSLILCASVLLPLTGNAQPAYSVIDLGRAPEPVVPILPLTLPAT